MTNNSQENIFHGVGTDSLTFAFEAAGIGVWDLKTGPDAYVVWDDRCKALFGISEANNIPYEETLQYFNEEDQKMVDEAVQHALNPEHGGQLDVHCRIVGVEDGILRFVRFIGKAFFDEAGNPRRFSGIGMDISSEMSAYEEQQKLKHLVQSSPDYMGIATNKGEVEFLNPAALKLSGIDPSVNIHALRSEDFFYPEEFKRITELYKIVVAEGSWAGRIYLRHFQTGEEIPCHASYETIVDPITGNAIGRSATLHDLRQELQAQKALQGSEALFRNVTQNAPTGLWMSDVDGGLIYLNKTLTDWTGMPYEDLLGHGWGNAVIEEDRQRSAEIFMHAVNTRTHYDVEFRIQKGDGSICWCRAAGDPYLDEEGNYAGYAGFCMDIHQKVEMANTILESEERIRSIVEQAPVAIGVMRGKELRVESANETILKLWGKNDSILGLPIAKALPELDGQVFFDLLANVYETGIPYNGNSILASLEHDGKIENLYFDFVYTPVKDSDGAINGVMVIASDVSRQVIAKQEVEASESKFRGLIEEAPVATAVLVGRELLIDVANGPMLKLWGKSESVMGMPLAKALPELEGQPFLQILQDIFETGKAFSAEEARAELEVDGELRTFYFNFTYKPLFDAEGEVYAIIDMAIDVTEQVINKQKIIEAETQLRSAIETAQLGTWEIHLLTGEFRASERMKKWFGFNLEDTMDFHDLLKGIPDNERLSNAVEKAKAGEKKGKLNVEYNLVNKDTGRAYVMESQGQTFFNEEGVPYLIIGSTRDITLQRQNEIELERLVQERTEELQATNEEMAATNEELADANENLFRSNEELAQYAYVASHDLQEPLRKIRMFADMLGKHTSLSEENRPLVEKINKSSERMTLLIKDLLEFSSLSKSEANAKKVDLNQVIKDVATDFELVISEKNAVVRIEELPVIDAVALQMNQLFYNLLSNALKFTGQGRQAEISVSSRVITEHEMQTYISKPIPSAVYHNIVFQDNGIGFEEEYAEQIFDVFKRLHGKDVYPGSGIGLALCRRIATNHGGYLFAESVPGKGTTFNLILSSTN